MPVGMAETISAQAVSSPTELTGVDHGSSARWLFIGGAPPPCLPESVAASRGSPCAGIILVARVEPAELAAALERAPDPAVPIADFGGNRGMRRDFAGDTLDAVSFAEVEGKFAAIWRRLADLPFSAAQEDRVEMTMLRLAYSRNTAIEASLDCECTSLVTYRLLGPVTGVRSRLEALAELDLLRRRHFTRTHACRRCSSARLHVYEACPACGGGDLLEERIVHHYRCGWQEPESKFAAGQALICPKCRRELRHFGVDYDKPGNIFLCRTCGAANAEPDVHFICLDCATATPAADAKSTDWYHYDLTEDGLMSLRDGCLPRLEIGPLLDGRKRVFSRREFELLVTEGTRITERYQRPFTVARLTVANAASLHHEHGPAYMRLAVRHAIDTILEMVRETDFIAADGAASVLIGFPETPAEEVGLITERVAKKIGDTISTPIELSAEIVKGQDVADVLTKD